MKSPCVSVIVTNFNYGQFLDRCLSSVLNQSHNNLELIICDNNSSDNSLEIIYNYIKLDPTRITLVRHSSNLGSASNYLTGERLIRGDFFINLGADDFLQPDYLCTAIKLFSNYPTVSQIVSHADSVDDYGNISKRTPFFDGSYFIPGLSYAPILMVAGITSHTSQTIFCTARHRQAISQSDFIYSTTLGERTNAMMHAMYHDVIYLYKPHVVCRDSMSNETFKLNSDVSQIIEQWSVINAFAAYAERHGFSEIYIRKDEAFEKLGSLCIRYATEFFRIGDYVIAGRYLGMSMLLKGGFDSLLSSELDTECFDGAVVQLKAVVEELQNHRLCSTTHREHSYAPPPHSIRLTI